MFFDIRDNFMFYVYVKRKQSCSGGLIIYKAFSQNYVGRAAGCYAADCRAPTNLLAAARQKKFIGVGGGANEELS